MQPVSPRREPIGSAPTPSSVAPDRTGPPEPLRSGSAVVLPRHPVGPPELTITELLTRDELRDPDPPRCRGVSWLKQSRFEFHLAWTGRLQGWTDDQAACVARLAQGVLDWVSLPEGDRTDARRPLLPDGFDRLPEDVREAVRRILLTVFSGDDLDLTGPVWFFAVRR